MRLLTVEIDYSLYKQFRTRAEERGVTPEDLAAAWIEGELAESSGALTNGSSAKARGDQANN